MEYVCISLASEAVAAAYISVMVSVDVDDPCSAEPEAACLLLVEVEDSSNRAWCSLSTASSASKGGCGC